MHTQVIPNTRIKGRAPKKVKQTALLALLLSLFMLVSFGCKKDSDKDLDARIAEIQSQEKAFAVKNINLEKRVIALEEKTVALQTREDELNKREADLDAREAALEIKEAEVSPSISKDSPFENKGAVVPTTEANAPDQDKVVTQTPPAETTPFIEEEITYAESGAGAFDLAKKEFTKAIPGISKKYVGMPYKLGGKPETDRKTDNSHLICAIYKKSAEKAGMKFSKYMPMRTIMENSYEVPENEIENGDLLMLTNNHVALIYDVQEDRSFTAIYTSERKKQVISVRSDDKNFREYWRKNKKGFYRIGVDLLTFR